MEKINVVHGITYSHYIIDVDSGIARSYVIYTTKEFPETIKLRKYFK